MTFICTIFILWTEPPCLIIIFLIWSMFSFVIFISHLDREATQHQAVYCVVKVYIICGHVFYTTWLNRFLSIMWFLNVLFLDVRKHVYLEFLHYVLLWLHTIALQCNINVCNVCNCARIMCTLCRLLRPTTYPFISLQVYETSLYIEYCVGLGPKIKHWPCRFLKHITCRCMARPSLFHSII